MAILIPLDTTKINHSAKPLRGGSIARVGTYGAGPSTGAPATTSYPAGITNGSNSIDFLFATVRESGRLATPAGYTPMWGATTTLTASTEAFYGWWRPVDSTSTAPTIQPTDTTGAPISTPDWTALGVVYSGVDQVKPMETTPEAFGGTNVLHWGRGARSGANPGGDTTTIANCLNLWIYMHSSAARTVDWGPEIVQVTNRTNAGGPEIILAEKDLFEAGPIGAYHLKVNSIANNAAMIQFCIRPATP
jgi:hypothetical protein